MKSTLLRRHRTDEALIPVATHLSSRGDRDRTVGFADVLADFDPEADFTGMPEDWRPARGAAELDHDATVSALADLRAEHDAPVAPTALRQAYDPHWLPLSVGLRHVDVTRIPLADIDENIQALAGLAVLALPLIGEQALWMHLAPIAALLDVEVAS